jgi:hypothetical protein
VESKRSYQLYWAAKDATQEGWYRVERGIVRALGADPKAIDPLRLLRAPGYYHWKDAEDPFLVTEVWRTNAVYSEAQALRAYGLPERRPKSEGPVSIPTGSIWTRFSSIPGWEAIERLNGHWLQQGEVFHTEQQANGNLNLVRDDGFRTGCWIRPDGSFGGVELGPTVAAWLAYYGWSWAEIATELRELFPEIGED